MKFNKQQLEAIEHLNGACAVIAGAGSGKSTVLVNRIKNMVTNGIKEDRILATTFTRNSSRDLKLKLASLNIRNVEVGTFHSVCSKILTNEGIKVNNGIKPYEVENIFKKSLGLNSVDYDDIISYISYQKNYMRNPDDSFVYKHSEYSEDELRIAYCEYEKYKNLKGLMDFDDYLLMAYKIIKRNSKYTYDYILVDEHQDTNMIQNELIKFLCPSGNVFCVFDYRQAIYTFRGGNPEYCMNFKTHYKDAKVINLDYNYRSTKDIVDNANRFIQEYYGNYKYYSPSIANNARASDIDYPYFVTKEDEASYVVKKIKKLINSGVNEGDIAVLYRNNNQSIHVENELKLNNIEYDIKDNGSFFKLREIDIILCMLRLIDNPSDDLAYKKLVDNRVYSFKFLKNTTLNELIRISATKNISLLDASDLIKTGNAMQDRNLRVFSNCISSLTRQNNQKIGLHRLVDNIIKLLNLEQYIYEKYPTESQINERLSYLENLKKFLRNNNVDSFLKYVYCKNVIQSNKSSSNKIQMMTIHGSKGLEFKHVFLIGNEDGKFPSSKSQEIDEARLFYVGITRAVVGMYITETGYGSKFVDIYKDSNRSAFDNLNAC